MTAPLVTKVNLCLNRWGVRPGGMIVAVSGGPDSLALLRVLLALRALAPAPAVFDPGRSLVIAHLNHQLRGAESDADERFVQSLHESLLQRGFTDLHLRCERADVAAQARRERSNLESVARRVRYNWLCRIAQEVQVSFVATGHTADDQAETVLHRLLRGTGLRGLQGIAGRRRLAPGIELLRPLLQVTRKEVLHYLEAEGQAYREDSSNKDLRYTRNRIRHELLPDLTEGYNPGLASALGHLAEQAAQVYQDLEMQAQSALAETERPRAGELLVFDQERLAALPRNLVREIFRLVWLREAWPMNSMGFQEWDRLAAVGRGEAVAVDLPGGIRARCRERVVLVGPGRLI